MGLNLHKSTAVTLAWMVLFPKGFTDTFCIGSLFQDTGAIATIFVELGFYFSHKLFIRIQDYLKHSYHSNLQRIGYRWPVLRPVKDHILRVYQEDNVRPLQSSWGLIYNGLLVLLPYSLSK